MKLKVLFTIIFLLAPHRSRRASSSTDSVRVKVASGTTCPAAWTASTESITTEDRYIVRDSGKHRRSASFQVSQSFVNAVWPTDELKAAAVASGVLVIQAGSTVEVHYCDLLP